MIDHSHAGLGSGDRILNAVKRNPEGLLLLGAGLALLLRGPARTAPKFRAFNDDQDDIHRSGRLAAGGIAETMSDVATNVRDVASDVGTKVGETVGSYASTAGAIAEDTRRAVMDKSGQYAQRAQSSIQDAVDRTLALAGFVAGAAIAAAFPASRMERKTLGPSGKTLSTVAASAQQKLTDAVSAAGGEIKRAAEERGLNASGMVEVAEGVAGAVKDSLASKQDTRTKRSDNGGLNRSDLAGKGKPALEEGKSSGNVAPAGGLGPTRAR